VEQAAYPNPFPADPAQASISEDKPSVVYVQQMALGYNNYLAWNPQHPEATAASQGWSQGGGGSDSTTWSGQVYGINESSSATINWPKDAGLVPTLPGHYHCDIYTNGSLQRVYDGDGNPTPFTFFFDLPLETFWHLVGSGQYPTNANGWAVPPTWSESAQYVVALFTGGKAGRQSKSLFILSQSLDWSTGDDYDLGQYDQSGPVPSTAITLGALGRLDTNGTLAVLVEDGRTVVITPRTGRPNYFGGLPGNAKYSLGHLVWACSLPLNRTTVGIGETVSLYGMPGETIWSVTGGGTVNPTNGSSTTFFAGFSPKASTVHAKYKGQELTQGFSVIAPSSITVVGYTNSPPGKENTNGILMGAQTIYSTIIGPTNVSFENAKLRENTQPFNVTWPNSTNWTYVVNSTTNPFSPPCGGFVPDDIQANNVPITWLFNGTNYIDFSFSNSWTDQYQDDSGNWVDYFSLNAKYEFRASDKKCRVTYLGMPGSWQGPY
jgi:hypothetical protein